MSQKVAPQGGSLIERAAERRQRGAAETRAIAGARIGRERELRDDQQAAGHVLHAAVHLASIVGKDAQLEQLGDQAGRVAFIVLRFGADEDEQAVVDGADDLARDLDTRLPHALHQGDQIRSLTLSKCASTSIGSNWIVARSPGTSLIRACSTEARTAAARCNVQPGGMCMCRST